MPYLIPKDYQMTIQDANILQIITNDQSVRLRAQLSGEAEAISYLRQKYNVDREFQETLPFDFNKTYYTFERFYLDAPTYNALSVYSLDEQATFQGSVYICTTAGATGTFNPSDWALLGEQYAIFSVKPPQPEFDFDAYYKVGDFVIWKNKVYQCLVASLVYNHDTSLQYLRIENLPSHNVAPDDVIKGVEYWGVGVPYDVTQELPSNTVFYEAKDNRDQQMVLFFCDIVLYHLHARIAPRNIPELRVKRYDDAIAWLKMCAEGAITPSLPLLTPKQGNRIRFGGNIRQINSY
jgi:hypothetical protein